MTFLDGVCFLDTNIVRRWKCYQVEPLMLLEEVDQNLFVNMIGSVVKTTPVENACVRRNQSFTHHKSSGKNLVHSTKVLETHN